MHVVVPIFLTSTLQSLCKILFFIWIWSTLDAKLLTGYSKEMSVLLRQHIFLAKDFVLIIDFLRQVISLPGEIIPLEYYSQTVCLHIGEIVPLDYFPETKILSLGWQNDFFEYFFPTAYVRCEEWRTDWQLRLCLSEPSFIFYGFMNQLFLKWSNESTVPVKVFPYNVKSIEYQWIHTSHKYLCCIAINTLQRALCLLHINP